MDGQPGKLTALAWLIREHREAVEIELIKHGERLRWMGTPRLSWEDVWAICRHAPLKSPLAIAKDPRAAWDVADYLAAAQADSLAFLAWAKTKDAKRNRNRPKPIPRPGTEERDGRITDVQVMDVDELKAYLARPRIET